MLHEESEDHGMAGVIDADTHIIESENVWQFFDADLRQKKPALVAFPDPDNGTVSHRWIIDGDVVPKPNGRGGVFLHTPPMSEQEAVDLDWACRSLTDPATRVAHMQRMGVETQVVYPTMFITFLTHDVKLEIAMCRSFARFMAEVWAQSENRLRWIAPLPLRSIDASLEAMHFAKDNGAVGVLFRGIEEELSLAEPYFEPVYAEAERLNLPICIHTGSGSPTFTEMCNSRYMGNFAHIRLLPLIAFHDLIANKVPERYPNLRFGFIEAAASWVPFLLHFLNRRNRVNKGQLGPIMSRAFGRQDSHGEPTTLLRARLAGGIMTEKHVGTSHLSRPTARRRLLRGAGLTTAGLLAASAAGCSRGGGAGQGQKAPAVDSGAKQPKRGGTITYAGGSGAGSWDVEALGFDPHTQLEFFAKSYTLIYQRLLAYNLRTWAVEPELAQKWEQPSQTEYVFHLQPGVTWHNKAPVNGRPLTTDDVLWSLERVRTNDPRFLYRSFLDSIDKVEAPDKATLRMTLKGPDAVMLKKLAIDNMAVLAREAVDKDPKLSTAESVIGTGAFVMTSMTPKVSAEYVRNPAYWKPGLPYLDGFRTQRLSDLLSAWSAFLANQVDAVLVPGSEVSKFITQQGPGYTPSWYADDTFGTLEAPNVRMKPMDDARVTRALRLLIDHDELIKSWAEVQHGKGGYGSIFPSALSAWDLTDAEYRSHLEWKQPKDDAAKQALSLLSAAGYSKDKPLRFELDSTSGNPAIPPAAQLVQAQWKRLSQGVVDVQLQLQDTGASQSTLAKRTFSFAQIGTSTGLVDPDSWLTTTYHSNGSQNYTGFSDPQADAMIDKQQTIFDETQRKAAVKEIILYMIDHGPSTIAANRFFLQAVRPRVQNHAPEYYLNGRQYQSVWLAS